MTRRTTGSSTRNGASSRARPTNLTTERIDTLLRWLSRSRIHVAAREAVAAYLRKHPELIEATRAAAKSMSRVISTPHECELYLERDPEIDYQYLALVVRMRSYGEGLLDLLDSIQEAADRFVPGSSGRLLVTTDFCEPAQPASSK